MTTTSNCVNMVTPSNILQMKHIYVEEKMLPIEVDKAQSTVGGGTTPSTVQQGSPPDHNIPLPTSIHPLAMDTSYLMQTEPAEETNQHTSVYVGLGKSERDVDTQSLNEHPSSVASEAIPSVEENNIERKLDVMAPTGAGSDGATCEARGLKLVDTGDFTDVNENLGCQREITITSNVSEAAPDIQPPKHEEEVLLTTEPTQQVITPPSDTLGTQEHQTGHLEGELHEATPISTCLTETITTISTLAHPTLVMDTSLCAQVKEPNKHASLCGQGLEYVDAPLFSQSGPSEGILDRASSEVPSVEKDNVEGKLDVMAPTRASSDGATCGAGGDKKEIAHDTIHPIATFLIFFLLLILFFPFYFLELAQGMLGAGKGETRAGTDLNSFTEEVRIDQGQPEISAIETLADIQPPKHEEEVLPTIEPTPNTLVDTSFLPQSTSINQSVCETSVTNNFMVLWIETTTSNCVNMVTPSNILQMKPIYVEEKMLPIEVDKAQSTVGGGTTPSSLQQGSTHDHKIPLPTSICPLAMDTSVLMQTESAKETTPYTSEYGGLPKEFIDTQPLDEQPTCVPNEGILYTLSVDIGAQLDVMAPTRAGSDEAICGAGGLKLVDTGDFTHLNESKGCDHLGQPDIAITSNVANDITPDIQPPKYEEKVLPTMEPTQQVITSPSDTLDPQEHQTGDLEVTASNELYDWRQDIESCVYAGEETLENNFSYLVPSRYVPSHQWTLMRDQIGIILEPITEATPIHFTQAAVTTISTLAHPTFVMDTSLCAQVEEPNKHASLCGQGLEYVDAPLFSQSVLSEDILDRAPSEVPSAEKDNVEGKLDVMAPTGGDKEGTVVVAESERPAEKEEPHLQGGSTPHLTEAIHSDRAKTITHICGSMGEVRCDQGLPEAPNTSNVSEAPPDIQLQPPKHEKEVLPTIEPTQQVITPPSDTLDPQEHQTGDLEATASNELCDWRQDIESRKILVHIPSHEETSMKDQIGITSESLTKTTPTCSTEATAITNTESIPIAQTEATPTPITTISTLAHPSLVMDTSLCAQVEEPNKHASLCGQGLEYVDTPLFSQSVLSEGILDRAPSEVPSLKKDNILDVMAPTGASSDGATCGAGGDKEEAAPETMHPVATFLKNFLLLILFFPFYFLELAQGMLGAGKGETRAGTDLNSFTEEVRIDQGQPEISAIEDIQPPTHDDEVLTAIEPPLNTLVDTSSLPQSTSINQSVCETSVTNDFKVLWIETTTSNCVNMVTSSDVLQMKPIYVELPIEVDKAQGIVSGGSTPSSLEQGYPPDHNIPIPTTPIYPLAIDTFLLMQTEPAKETNTDTSEYAWLQKGYIDTQPLDEQPTCVRSEGILDTLRVGIEAQLDAMAPTRAGATCEAGGLKIVDTGDFTNLNESKGCGHLGQPEVPSTSNVSGEIQPDIQPHKHEEEVHLTIEPTQQVITPTLDPQEHQTGDLEVAASNELYDWRQNIESRKDQIGITSESLTKTTPTCSTEATAITPTEFIPTADIKAIPTAHIEAIPTAHIEATPTAHIEAIPTAHIEATPTPIMTISTLEYVDAPLFSQSVPSEGILDRATSEVPSVEKDNVEGKLDVMAPTGGDKEGTVIKTESERPAEKEEPHLQLESSLHLCQVEIKDSAYQDFSMEGMRFDQGQAEVSITLPIADETLPGIMSSKPEEEVFSTIEPTQQVTTPPSDTLDPQEHQTRDLEVGSFCETPVTNVFMILWVETTYSSGVEILTSSDIPPKKHNCFEEKMLPIEVDKAKSTVGGGTTPSSLQQGSPPDHNIPLHPLAIDTSLLMQTEPVEEANKHTSDCSGLEKVYVDTQPLDEQPTSVPSESIFARTPSEVPSVEKDNVEGKLDVMAPIGKRGKYVKKSGRKKRNAGEEVVQKRHSPSQDVSSLPHVPLHQEALIGSMPEMELKPLTETTHTSCNKATFDAITGESNTPVISTDIPTKDVDKPMQAVDGVHITETIHPSQAVTDVASLIDTVEGVRCGQDQPEVSITSKEHVVFTTRSTTSLMQEQFDSVDEIPVKKVPVVDVSEGKHAEIDTSCLIVSFCTAPTEIFYMKHTMVEEIEAMLPAKKLNSGTAEEKGKQTYNNVYSGCMRDEGKGDKLKESHLQEQNTKGIAENEITPNDIPSAYQPANLVQVEEPNEHTSEKWVYVDTQRLNEQSTSVLSEGILVRTPSEVPSVEKDNVEGKLDKEGTVVEAESERPTEKKEQHLQGGSTPHLTEAIHSAEAKTSTDVTHLAGSMEEVRCDQEQPEVSITSSVVGDIQPPKYEEEVIPTIEPTQQVISPPSGIQVVDLGAEKLHELPSVVEVHVNIPTGEKVTSGDDDKIHHPMKETNSLDELGGLAKDTAMLSVEKKAAVSEAVRGGSSQRPVDLPDPTEHEGMGPEGDPTSLHTNEFNWRRWRVIRRKKTVPKELGDDIDELPPQPRPHSVAIEKNVSIHEPATQLRPHSVAIEKNVSLPTSQLQPHTAALELSSEDIPVVPGSHATRTAEVAQTSKTLPSKPAATEEEKTKSGFLRQKGAVRNVSQSTKDHK